MKRDYYRTMIEEPNFDEITSIDTFYEYLDLQAIILNEKGDLLDTLLRFRNGNLTATEKQTAQWELEAFLFDFKGNKLFSFSHSTSDSVGKVQAFPTLDDFQKGGFDYLKKRTGETKNPFLLARYHHLLWNGPPGIKNKTYVREAIYNYTELIKQYVSFNHQEQDPIKKWDTTYYTGLLICLCSEVRESSNAVKQFLADLLKGKVLPFHSKHSIIQNMLEYKALFKPVDFEGITTLFQEELNNKMDKIDSFQWTHYYFKTAISVARKLNESLAPWYERVGDCYVLVAEWESQEESRLWLKYDAYASAITAYRQSGNKAKKERIEQLLFELKSKVKLPTVRIERSQAEIKRLIRLDKFIRKSAEELLKQPPEIIYENLISGWYYPSKRDILGNVKKKEYFYEKHLTPVFFDNNKNIRKEISGDHSQKKFYDFYHSYINMVTNGFLFHTLVPGIRSGHLNFKNFIAYLSKNTWLGEPYLKTDLGGNEVQVNWLSMLSPALVEYFLQVQSWTLSNTYVPTFILAIDSLTLKMEGLLRNFAARLNVSTTVGGKDGLQEVYVHNVLDNPLISIYFGEDDLQFFKYLFANEGGINLRNNVAHCYYNFTDYNLNKMHLLIAALIKIGQYSVDREQVSK